MADDARISTAFPHHHKTVKLERRLGAAGFRALIRLWLWTADNRCDGDLRDMTVEDIEIAADWSGDAGAFVGTLVEVGFLDGGDGCYWLHDWADHQPYVAARPQRSKVARLAALKKWNDTTPEQRSEAARHAAKAKWAAVRAGRTDDACERDASRTDDACDVRAPFPTLPVPAQHTTIAPHPQADAAPDADEVGLRELKSKVRSEIQSHWGTFNKGVTLPWDGRAAKNLTAVLKANPSWRFDEFAHCIRHRFQSERNHSEAPYKWLPSLTDYLGGPLDRFGQPIHRPKANGGAFHFDGDNSQYTKDADYVLDNRQE
jgi:hypothetical protein